MDINRLLLDILNEFDHAAGHAVDCEDVKCPQCKRLLKLCCDRYVNEVLLNKDIKKLRG